MNYSFDICLISWSFVCNDLLGYSSPTIEAAGSSYSSNCYLGSYTMNLLQKTQFDLFDRIKSDLKNAHLSMSLLNSCCDLGFSFLLAASYLNRSRHFFEIASRYAITTWRFDAFDWLSSSLSLTDRWDCGSRAHFESFRCNWWGSPSPT
jgi:hypothetical protein